MMPREELDRIGDEVLESVLVPLSWSTIKQTIQHMDHCAIGGVSPYATLIASLVVHLYEARVHPSPPA